VHKQHILILTAIRGVAAWWVVLFHFRAFLFPYLGPLFYLAISKGYLAVDLFFSLSGFVLLLNYDEAKLTVRNVRTYYIKRVARIYPLHVFMLFAYVLLIGVVLLLHHGIPADRFSLEEFGLNLLLLQDWVSFAALSWNTPAWSISAELAAYFIFPFIVPAVNRLSGVGSKALVFGAALLILNIGFRAHDFDIGSAIGTLGLLRCVAQFTLGAITAALYLRFPRPGRIAKIVLLLLVAASVFGAQKYGTSLFMPLAWNGLIYAAAANKQSKSLRFFGWLVFVGEISYATYICHYFFYDVFKLVAVRSLVATTPFAYLAITFFAIFAASVILHLFIEVPAHRLIVKGRRHALG